MTDSRRFLLSLATMAALSAPPIAHAAIPDSERQALLDLYASTHGDEWTLRDNWNGPPGSECTWYGVICNTDQSHVTGLSLGVEYDYATGNHLDGPLPPSLSDLTELETLQLARNQLDGPLPSLQRMHNLEDVEISRDGLTGPFPDLAGLSKLEYFLASNNQFEGPIPPLTGLDSLEAFFIDGNFISAPFPDLSGAPALQVFSAHWNLFFGPVPSLTALTALTSFDVSGNVLSGPLPRLAVTDAYINMGGNLFSGPIPPEYLALRAFDGSYNQLTGPVPPPQATADSINLAGNALDGSLPSFDAAANLSGISFRNNQLTGTIPSLAGAPMLMSIDVSDNALTGAAPAEPSPLLIEGAYSHLCPNYLDAAPDAGWDTATGSAPWYAGCPEGAHQNLSQFGLGGTWYNPATGGQGIVLSSMWVQGNWTSTTTLFGGWFTYVPDATPATGGQRWYSFQGDADPSTTVASLDLYESTTGRFGAPPIVATSRIGSVTLAFDDCTHGTMTYHFDDRRVADGSFALVRLTGSTGCTRTGDINPSLGTNNRFTGAYYDPAASGQGFMIDVSATQHTLFGAWYTYATDAGADNRRWYSLQADFPVSADALSNPTAPGDFEVLRVQSVPLYSSVGGEFGASTPVTTTEVGNVDIAFDYCLNMTLTYRFTAGENQGYNGPRTLRRLGPVPTYGCN